MAKYTYAKQVNAAQLLEEVQKSGIATSLDYNLGPIKTIGDTVDIYYISTLSTGDETTLTNTVNAHIIDPTYSSVPSDSDNAPIIRLKAAAKGWTYHGHPFEFKTSELDSVYCKSYDNTDRGFVSVKFYKDDNGSEVEITGTDLNQAFLDANCIRTDVEWEPTHDYEIVGGMISTYDNLVNDFRVWVVAVPDIPAPNGSKEMCGGVNLRYYEPKHQLSVDGKVTKTLKFDTNYHTNKLKFVLRHQSGEKCNLQVVLDLFKQ
jgi:hypothetical protein